MAFSILHFLFFFFPPKVIIVVVIGELDLVILFTVFFIL